MYAIRADGRNHGCLARRIAAMSYLVLARKYRPRHFAQLVGQEHVVQALSNALTTQRLHHAYLFTGTRGVGKTTISRILAKSLNCQGVDGQGGITATPCGVCQACQDIDSGRFVDYTELDAASNRGVDEVQALLEQAVYKPVQGRFKVFMIDEVHMLTNTAFNAMLKTLEEPPAYLKFVLATTDPQKVPVTVLSRCLQFNLRPMAPDTVLSHLELVLRAEQVPAQVGALRLISRAARGSMRDALSLTDQAIAFGQGQLQEASVRQMLGSVDRSYIFQIMDALARRQGRQVVEVVDALRTHGLSAAATLEEMCATLQRMAVLQVVPDMLGSADADDPDAGETARLSQLLPADETQLLYSLCLHGRGELGLAPDEYAALTMVLLRLLAFQSADGAPASTAPAAPLAEKKTLKSAELAQPQPETLPPHASVPFAQGQPPAPAVAREPVAAAPAALVSPTLPAAPVTEQQPAMVTPVVPTTVGAGDAPAATQSPQALYPAPDHAPAPPDVAVDAPQASPALAVDAAPGDGLVEHGDVWYATVQQLVAAEAVTALVRELALQSQLVDRQGARWLLRIERESLNQANARERLRAALESAGYASVLDVDIGAVTDSPAKRNALAAQQRQQRAEATVRSDAYVQTLVRDYEAKIVPGSIRAL